MRRLAASIFLLFALFPAAAAAQRGLQAALSTAMRGAGSGSGAYVIDASTHRQLFASRSETARSLASNTKLFTSAAVLGLNGPDSTLATELLGSGQLQPDGTWTGDLYLRGGGDPTFGTRSFAQRAYGSAASVEALADGLRQAGFTQVTGSVFGDESRFDALRGTGYSGFHTSFDIGGPLSAVDLDRGLANSRGSAFQSNPPQFAASKLLAALRGDGIRVRGHARTGPAPFGAVTLAEARSPSFARLLQLENKESDNYFAEMLLKGLPDDAASGAPVRRSGAPLPPTPTPAAPASAQAAAAPGAIGTTAAGAAFAVRYARSLGARVQMVDGSGLSRADRASPHQVVRLLDAVRAKPWSTAFDASLPVAGRDGTLHDRMRHGPARGNCHAKTGTLIGVSALSGYCRTRSGNTLIFSVLNSGLALYRAHAIQDRVAQVLAGSG